MAKNKCKSKKVRRTTAAVSETVADKPLGKFLQLTDKVKKGVKRIKKSLWWCINTYRLIRECYLLWLVIKIFLISIGIT